MFSITCIACGSGNVLCLKHRLCLLVRTASARPVLMYIQNLCFEQKYEKYQTFSDKFFMSFYFLQLRKNLYIAWRVFVMLRLQGSYSILQRTQNTLTSDRLLI